MSPAADDTLPVIRNTRYYRFCRRLVWLVNLVFFRARWLHVDRVPLTGPLLIVANHVSFLDPPLIGCAIRARALAYLARSGLFRFKPLGMLLRSFNSVPVAESGGDVAAMRTVIALLQAGNAVLIFPEGSRSPDGNLHEFKRGVALILRKALCPVLPVAVDGPFRAWPRHRRFPILLRHRVAAIYGHPIPHDELLACGPDAALERLHAEVARLLAELQELQW
ncbi:MAG: 1-acyl-sn-glycerol-3-phosphate acyltransferase [Phycisphaerales bacterium]|nr:1-acyl-sn-glycerol-3-phosphate acyltransferase [Phycisphaerales bacterium]